MKRLFIILFLVSLFSTPSVLMAQAQCNNYDCMIAQAREALRKEHFKLALDKARVAKAYDATKEGEVNVFIDQVFAVIEKKRVEAETQQIGRASCRERV